MKKRLNNEGFSLVEVMISIVLLSVGLLAVAGMQTTAMSSNVVSRDVTMAVQMAEEIVDRIRLNGGNSPEIYNSIDTSGSCSTFPEPAKGDCTQWQARLKGTNLFNIKGTVDVDAETPIGNSAKISVSVTWGAGGDKKIDFTTIMETWGT